MIPWTTITEWGGRLTVVTGLATPVYAGLAYLQLTPVTESYVTTQINNVQKSIQAGRVETLDTKRVVLGIARDNLVREQQGLVGALRAEKNPVTLMTFSRRVEQIKAEVDLIDRRLRRLDEKIEGMKASDE